MLKTVKPWSTVVMLVILSLAGLAIVYDKYIAPPAATAYDNLTSTPAVPEGATIIITGPTEIKAGQLARLDVSKSLGSVFKWKILPEGTDFEAYDGGKHVIFTSATSGEFTFIVASARDNAVDVQTFVIKVGEGVSPAPITPASGMAGKVIELSKLVTSTTKKSEASKLSAGFASVAKQIQDGQLTTVDQIIAAQKAANVAAVGTNTQAWVPFLEGLQKEMKTQAEAGLLVTPEQHATLWRQIAEGLALVAK
jgi:hypothetical protein